MTESQDHQYSAMPLQEAPRIFSKSWMYKGKSVSEQNYLCKLDFFLLSSAMLGYFIKSLNQRNISTAYLNGMSEYYNMDKNEFNYMQSAFFLGYLFGGFPSKYLLTKFKPRLYLGSLEMMWGLLTLTMCLCRTINEVYIVRFAIGFLEAGFFPSIVFIIGSFYNAAEMGKRQALFNVSSAVGTIITGPLQQLVLSHDVSVGKLEKFQILFLLDAAISLPIAFYTMVVNPGLPTAIDVWYLNDEDKAVAKERMTMVHVAKPIQKEEVSMREYFNSWHCIMFPLLFSVIKNTASAMEPIISTTWIKFDLQLPSVYYNYFPSIISAIAIVTTVGASVVNDRSHGKMTAKLIYTFFSVYLMCSLLLVYWKIPVLLHWACYIAYGFFSWSSPQLFSWLNMSLAADDQKRHFLVVLANSFDYAIYAVYPVFAWDTREKPVFKKGFTSTAILSVFGIGLTWLTARFVERDRLVRPANGLPLIDEETPLL